MGEREGNRRLCEGMTPRNVVRTGADLAVLVREVDGLHQPQRLVHVAPDRQVIDGDLIGVEKWKMDVTV